MNKNKVLLSSLVGTAMLGVSTLGLAAAPTLMTPTTVAPACTAVSGPYIGAQIGIGGMDTKKLSQETKEEFPTIHKEDIHHWDPIVGRIFGGYLWSQDALSYGAELGFAMYPDNTYKLEDNQSGPTKYNYKYEGYNIDLLGVVKYVVANNLNVFGKAGVAYASQKFSLKTESSSMDKTEYEFLPEVAVGVGYDINQNVAIDLTYSHIFGKSPKEYSDATDLPKDLYKDVASVDALMLGINYHIV